MTSEARKQAWLAALTLDDDNPDRSVHAQLWGIKRGIRTYYLWYFIRRRCFELEKVPSKLATDYWTFSPSLSAEVANRILPAEVIADCIAASITRNHARRT
jgi:hypothetical protein